MKHQVPPLLDLLGRFAQVVCVLWFWVFSLGAFVFFVFRGETGGSGLVYVGNWEWLATLGVGCAGLVAAGIIGWLIRRTRTAAHEGPPGFEVLRPVHAHDPVRRVPDYNATGGAK
jgi:hypothetical protein